MVAMVPPRQHDASISWRKILAPWLRALEGKVSMSLPLTAGALPTRQDVQKIKINVSMARIGRDRDLWCAILEAIELLDALWYVNWRLCWTLVLQACGRSTQQLPFPLVFLDGVRPAYTLCIVEEDVVYAYEQIMDVFDVFLMRTPDWNHSPVFSKTLKRLQDAMTKSHTLSLIAVSCHFEFEDEPVSALPFRIESVKAVLHLARFLQAFQEPAHKHTNEDSVFVMTAFEFDFNDGPLIAHEVSTLTSILYTIPVTSLRFGAWYSMMMPPELVEDFCNTVFARRNFRAQDVTGIETLAFHPTEMLEVDTFDICMAISESESLRQVTFSDAWLGGVVNESLRRQWFEWALFAFFRNNILTQTKFHTATFKLRYCTVSDIVRVREGLNREVDRFDDLSEASTSQPSSAYETASENGDQAAAMLAFQRYRVYDFTSIADDFPEDPDACGAGSEDDGDVSIVLPDPAPYRSSNHPVSHLTIEFDHDTSDESSLELAVALAWFVGEPLTRLTILGSRSYGAVSLLTFNQLEQVLTACPSLQRLELSYIEIQTLSPFVDPTLCGQLHSLVIDRCNIRDKASVRQFYAALGDATHPLYHSLQALHMCEEDDTAIETAHFALKMLAKNDKLQQFVVRSHADGVALKLLHRFRRFDGIPVATGRATWLPLEYTLAFLSILPTVFGPNHAQSPSAQEAATRILEMAATPLYRHCTVVSS